MPADRAPAFTGISQDERRDRRFGYLRSIAAVQHGAASIRHFDVLDVLPEQPPCDRSDGGVVAGTERRGEFGGRGFAYAVRTRLEIALQFLFNG
jgi:hypothetical protein